MALLASYGLPEYWLVDPAASILEMYTQSPNGLALTRVFEADQVVTSGTLPGLTYPLSSVFAL